MLCRPDRHVDDDALLAFQLDQLEQRRVLDVATHLQACTCCAERLDALSQGLTAAGELTGDPQLAGTQEDQELLQAHMTGSRKQLRLEIAGLGLLAGGGAMGLLYHASPGATPAVGFIALATIVTLGLVLISVGTAQRLLTSGEQIFRRRYMSDTPPRPHVGPGWTRSVVLGLLVSAMLVLAYLLVLGPRAAP